MIRCRAAKKTKCWSIICKGGEKIKTVPDNVGMSICVCEWSEMTECRYIAFVSLAGNVAKVV